MTALDQLGNRLKRMHKHLGKWARRQGISCYRLYDHDISDQPLVVDRYGDDVVCWSWRRTKDETDQQDQAWMDGVRAAIREGLGVADDHLFCKRRRQQSDRQHGGQYGRLDERRVLRSVGEDGLRFEINLSDYLDVGLFLDHRPLRRRVGGESAGKDVLNLFCYTGAFTCHAARGGARSTTSVDLSHTYLDWTQRNLVANDLAGDRHHLIRADCLAWLREAPTAAWDLIVCDPPTFSNSTAMAEDWSVDRDQDWLVAQLLRLLRPGGTAYFSTNSRRFAPGTVLAPFPEITGETTDEDFRGHPAHRCWRLGR